MKKISLSFLVIAILMISFFSCEKESNEILTDPVEKETKITRTSFEEMIQDPVFESKIKEYESLYNVGTSLQKNDNSSTLDTTKMVKTVDGNTTIYSIYVVNPNLDGNTYENLVVEKKGSIVDAYVLRMSRVSRKLIGMYEDEHLFNQLNLKNDGTFDCVKSEEFCYIDDPDGHYPNNGPDGNCNPVTEYDFSDCVQSGDDGGTNNGDTGSGDDSANNSDDTADSGGAGDADSEGSGGTGGGSYDGDDGGRDGGSVGVIDGYSRLTSEINGYFSSGLSTLQLDWLDSHPGEAVLFSDFLETYNSQDAKNLAEQAINNFMSFSSLNYPGKDDGLPYEWWNSETIIESNFSFELDDEGFRDLTAKEKILIAVFPVEALIIRANIAPARAETINRFGNNGRNDKSDAFRHAFFNAMNANDAGIARAKLFADAHESEVPINLIKEKEMDLFNNDVGLDIGEEASTFVSDNDLSNSVYQALLNGDLVYLSPLGPVVPPNFGINSSTQLTPTNK